MCLAATCLRAKGPISTERMPRSTEPTSNLCFVKSQCLSSILLRRSILKRCPPNKPLGYPGQLCHSIRQKASCQSILPFSPDKSQAVSKCLVEDHLQRLDRGVNNSGRKTPFYHKTLRFVALQFRKNASPKTNRPAACPLIRKLHPRLFPHSRTAARNSRFLQGDSQATRSPTALPKNTPLNRYSKSSTARTGRWISGAVVEDRFVPRPGHPWSVTHSSDLRGQIVRRIWRSGHPERYNGPFGKSRSPLDVNRRWRIGHGQRQEEEI